MARPRILGLCGAIGAGKSTAAETLRSLSVRCFDADRAGHEALRTVEVKRAAFETWGGEIFQAADGNEISTYFLENFTPSDADESFWNRVEIDRGRLARLVFNPADTRGVERGRLEAMTHPLIERAFRAQTDEAALNQEEWVVLDAALLFESGWNRFCDTIVFIDAEPDVRLCRVNGRGWSAEELSRREAAQMPNERKKAMSDSIINNNGDKNKFRTEIKVLFLAIKGKNRAVFE